MMPLKCDPVRKIVDDSGFPRTPDILLKFCGTHVWLLEVFKTMTSTCRSYNLGGSATTCANPRRRVEARMEHGGHASGVFCPRHPSSPLCFEWRDGGESNEIEPKRIFVWWVNYVDTIRPRSVRRLDERQMPTVEHYRTVMYKLS
jgi:hypothetical protein